MINGLNSSRSRNDTNDNIYAEGDLHISKDTSKSKEKKYARMFEDDMDNIEFKRNVTPYVQTRLDHLTDRIKYWDSATMLYEEEKVEGDYQEAAMRCNSLQNGGIDEYEEYTEGNFNSIYPKNCNIFGQEVEKGEEIA